jgi:hypothetical protein
MHEVIVQLLQDLMILFAFAFFGKLEVCIERVMGLLFPAALICKPLASVALHDMIGRLLA